MPISASPRRPAGAYLTPLVRKLAGEYGIDPGVVAGSGRDGRVRKQDILAAAKARTRPAPGAAPAVAGRPGSIRPMAPERRLAGERAAASLRTSAQLTTVVEADLSRIVRLIDRAGPGFAVREGVPLGLLPFYAAATVEALKAHPVVNARLDPEAGTITYPDAEHLGLTVDTDRGPVVPVLRDAGGLSLAGLARRAADLAGRARTGTLNSGELEGGTFTLTDSGERGALFDTPVVHQPQSAVLSVGAPVRRPVAVTDDLLGDTIAIRPTAYLALSYDHRLIDGADAARFLRTVKYRLESAAFEAALP
ncbi:2-oxo acid dehydrogenase subunit E2 [Streptomyces sp. CA-111067]|uniref:2-oxo acid dehydrogenase subunit E2 n=1 Tax=Streptomyces sp. CA-111067 TaxID=3240046 RepID=UPI003D963AB8